MILYELIGTAVLVGALNISGGKTEALGLALFMIIMAFGPVSGAHVNPAVSLGIFIKESKIENLCFLLEIWVA